MAIGHPQSRNLPSAKPQIRPDVTDTIARLHHCCDLPVPFAARLRRTLYAGNLARSFLIGLFAILLCPFVKAADKSEKGPSEDQLLDLFADHCYECHGYGESEGGLSFETLAAGGYKERTRAKWEAIWKNLRSETMPPSHATERPDDAIRQRWLRWIQSDVFHLSPDDIDPGRVTLRRLNRNEYQRTIRDLTDVRLDVQNLLPADNTGYGFDTIGEALTLSPVVLERYIDAASRVVDELIPLDGPSAPIQPMPAWQWREGSLGGELLRKPMYIQGTRRIVHPIEASEKGTYEFVLHWTSHNGWVSTPQTADIYVYLAQHESSEDTTIARLIAGKTPILRTKLEFNEEKPQQASVRIDLDAGRHAFVIEAIETNDDIRSRRDGEEARYSLYPRETRLQGPFNSQRYEYPPKTRKILFNGPPKKGESDQATKERAREVLGVFARKAFRRPCDDATLDRLSELVVKVRNEPGMRYEHGMAQAIKLILVSPRFLYRGETPRKNDAGDEKSIRIDDYSLATRLSYLIWGSTPDDQLMAVAAKGRLHEQLDNQITRLLSDEWRRKEGLNDFLGQWLRIRDIDHTNIELRVVLREKSQSKANQVFSWHIQDAMAKETEHMFDHLIMDNEPAHRLLNAKYTFLNEALAKFYGIDGIQGDEMRRVDYPVDAHRRGVLSHGSILLVTSNPTRTSPVKRGLFVLENLLGVPSPPAPPDVPALESSAKGELEHASLRDVLKQHRADPACASCHSRMDPLGLAMENFNAIGQYREKDYPPTENWWIQKDVEQIDIDSSGQLMTGETFDSIEELAEILATERRRDFHRCLTEKWMTYALGRGLTYRDATVIEQIVDQVEHDGGGMQTLLRTIIHSKPFTHMRRVDSEDRDGLAQHEKVNR